MDRPKEKEIIALLQDPERQREAFEQVVQKYSETLYWQIRRLILSHEDANDILQNTFIKAWQNLEYFRGDAKMSTWLYRIAFNECLSFLNSKHQEKQVSIDNVETEVLNKLEMQLAIHGRVSHDKVLHILKGTHFTLLMRSSEQRYAKAGFPTKVVESLSRSTPVICNLTSDLGEYLADGGNALLVEECCPTSLQRQLCRAIEMSKIQRADMCSSACKTASKRFSYGEYLATLGELIND